MPCMDIVFASYCDSLVYLASYLDLPVIFNACEKIRKVGLCNIYVPATISVIM